MIDSGSDHLSDEQRLVRRAAAGDDAAWRQVLRCHQEAVFRLAFLIVGDAAEAEDVAQESFIRALRYLERFDGSRPLRPWLLQITRNTARNRQRAGSRYRAALRRLWLARRAEPAATPEERQARRADAETLWQAVRRLRPADQEVIYLRYFLELSVAETALALEVAEGTVKSRLHRALGRLKQVVAQHYPALAADYEKEGMV